MIDSEAYKKQELALAIQRVYFWQHHNTHCFSDMLFDLFQKADALNRHRLHIVFPFEYHAWKSWNEAGNYGQDLFDEWLMPNGKIKEPSL